MSAVKQIDFRNRFNFSGADIIKCLVRLLTTQLHQTGSHTLLISVLSLHDMNIRPMMGTPLTLRRYACEQCRSHQQLGILRWTIQNTFASWTVNSTKQP